MRISYKGGMNLRHLRTFIAIVDAGGVARAQGRRHGPVADRCDAAGHREPLKQRADPARESPCCTVGPSRRFDRALECHCLGSATLPRTIRRTIHRGAYRLYAATISESRFDATRPIASTIAQACPERFNARITLLTAHSPQRPAAAGVIRTLADIALMSSTARYELVFMWKFISYSTNFRRILY